MMRPIVQNNYSEEFKRNTVAVIRAGLPLRVTAKKLTVPVNTIAYWLTQDKFKDIGPAPEPLIKAVFEQSKLEPCVQKSMLVQVTRRAERKEASDKSLVKVNYGKLRTHASKRKFKKFLQNKLCKRLNLDLRDNQRCCSFYERIFLYLVETISPIITSPFMFLDNPIISTHINFVAYFLWRLEKYIGIWPRWPFFFSCCSYFNLSSFLTKLSIKWHIDRAHCISVADKSKFDGYLV